MIQELRREISAVDREIAKLLCTRFRLVGEIQRVKAAQRMPAEDLSRESEVLENVKGSAPERFRNDLKEIFAMVMAIGKRQQLG
jgi:chorismate mutase